MAGALPTYVDEFLERTVNGNFKINLNRRNILDIALIRYGYGVKQELIFEAFDDIEDFNCLLTNYVNDNTKSVPLVVIFKVHNHWSTIIVSKSTKSAYYMNYYGNRMPNELKAEFASIEFEVHELVKFVHDIKSYDSGVTALETAGTLDENKGQLLPDKLKELFNSILSYKPIDIIEKRKTLANCLQIMQIQKMKLNTLTDNLTKVMEQINSGGADNFNYFNANVFIYFLETFALQDLHMEYIEPKYKDYLKNIINGEDIKCIASIRSQLLLHRDSVNTTPDIVNPQHFNKIINSQVCKSQPLVKDFFQHVTNYVNYISSIFHNATINNGQLKQPCEFLEKTVTKIGHDVNLQDYNKQIDSHLENFLTKAFSSPCYRKDKQAHHEEQQGIFDLIVNFAPYFDNAFNKRSEILKEMRNIQIHEFYRYNDEQFAIEYALTNYLRENKNSLFKFCYSRYIYPLLKEFNGQLEKMKNNKPQIEIMKTELYNSLETFSGKHSIKLSKQQSISNQCSHANGQQTAVERVFKAQVSLCNNPQNDAKNEIMKTVKTYFKLLLLIANEGSQNNNNNTDEYITRRYKYLKVEQILKIKTDLEDLQRLKVSSPPGLKNNYEDIKKSLKQQFKIDYGIMDNDFEAIVLLTIKCHEVQVDEYNYYIDYLSNHVDIIKKQQNEYKCSAKDILKMYRERKGLTFNRGSLEEKISSLAHIKLWSVNILLGDSTSQRQLTSEVSPDRFVTIIFEIMCNESQKPLYDDINRVFNDCEFLDYLGKQDIFLPNLMKAGLDFLIPLVARIIALPNYGISIKDKSLCNTIEKLADKDYIVYLKPIMMKVYKNKGTQNIKTKLLEIICACILKNYKCTTNIEYLDNILGSQHIANDIIGIFLRMPEDADINKIIVNILDTLVGTSFTIACDFKNYDRALELLTMDNINDAVEKLKDIALDLYCSVKLNVARYHYKIKDNVKSIEILQDTLSKATTQEVKPFYLFTLSYMAKIQNKERLYEEAYNNYYKLYVEYLEYILGAPPTEFNIKVYNDVTNHAKYKNAQAVSSKYLEILRIKSDMAFSKKYIGNINKQNCEEALTIYEEVHEIQRVILGNSHKETIKTKRAIAFVIYSIGLNAEYNHKINEAIQYYLKALEYNKEVFVLQKTNLWPTHPAVKASFKNVMNVFKKLLPLDCSTCLFKDYDNFVNSNMADFKINSPEADIEWLNKILNHLNRYQSCTYYY